MYFKFGDHTFDFKESHRATIDLNNLNVIIEYTLGTVLYNVFSFGDWLKCYSW